jgi:RNA polymerase sigma factor (sigma-70 family)
MIEVKGGNLSELSELFERYQVKIYNYFLRQTFDKAASEDLTQNLFYRIIKYRHTYRAGEGSFKSWIYQLARNIHFDYCKQQRRMPDHVRMGDGDPDQGTQKAESFVEDDFERLEQAMMQLQPEHRELILLSRFQGLRYSEISRIRGSSVTAVKVQMYRAMKHLRDIYYKTQQKRRI